MNQVIERKPAALLIAEYEESFTQLIENSKVKIDFKQEAFFALQALQNNNFLLGIATNNPSSFKNAILNVAAIGVTLNPACKHAYLVPRKGAVCLDISYLGLVEIAVSSGSVVFVQSKIVRESDTFELNGIAKEPTHKYNPFKKDRGSIVGCYTVAKIHDGSFLTEVMSIEDIYAIRDRSESFKKKSGPWVTDEEEMIKKTVIKRASKLWPRVDINNRLDLAVQAANQDEIDFDAENEEMKLKKKIEIVSQREAANAEREAKDELCKKCVVAINEKLKNVNVKEKAQFLKELGVTGTKDLRTQTVEQLEAILEKCTAK